jgi:hypothetical protein
MDKAQALKIVITSFCKEIGCSMLSSSCPGNPLCDIARKAMPWIKNVELEILAERKGEAEVAESESE